MPFSEYQLLRQKTGYPSEMRRNVPLCDTFKGRRARFLRLRKHPIPPRGPPPVRLSASLACDQKGAVTQEDGHRPGP